MSFGARNGVSVEGNQLRVLVVERDAAGARATLRRLAEASPGWMVQSARSASDASRLIARRPWDAVVVAEDVWDEHEGFRAVLGSYPEVAVVLVRDGDSSAPSTVPVVARDLLGSAEGLAMVAAAVRQQRRLRHRETMLRWLEREARADPLTGLANRVAFEEEFTALCAEARSRHLPVALILFDVVGLRVVTDVHGREAADRLLQRVGRVLSSAVRTGDIAARVEGGRFAVALSGAGIELARRIARRVAHQLEQASQLPGELPVAVSIAVAAANAPERDELWELASAQLRTPRTVPIPLAAFGSVGGDDDPSVA